MRPGLEILLSLLGLTAGLVLAFAGYRLAKRLAALAGFLVGFVVGLPLGAIGGIVGSVVAALVLGVAFALLFALAFRLVGPALGGAAGYTLAQALGWPTWAVVLSVVAGVVAGFLAHRMMIVAATSYTGASLAATSAVLLAGDLGVAEPTDVQLAIGILALAAVGALVQWRQVRHEG